MTTRRELFKAAAVGAVGLALPRAAAGLPAASPEVFRAATGLAATSDAFTIEDIDTVTVRVPFRPTPERAMDRELPHWRWTEILSVRLGAGAVGHGETLLYYTWGATGDDDIARARGGNAVELMWDDSLGAGLQMALFDAVARTAGVPVHRLLGRQVHERTPVAWWNIDMPPEDMAAECALAHSRGYTAYKTKGRPWFDIWEQCTQIERSVPASFKVAMDFNETLLDAERALPICRDLAAFPQIDIYESPIPQRDVAGNIAIRAATRVQIALHFGRPRPAVVVREGVCDGFVVNGGATRVLRQGAFAAEVDMPLWLQLVGTGLTAAFSLHFGAVLEQAVWPAVNCHQLFTHDLLAAPIVVEDGYADVPDGPGLGCQLDEDAIERFRVDKPAQRPDPPRLVEARWPDGRHMYFASGSVNFVLRPAMRGQLPFYERGVSTRLWTDDGSPAWRQMWERAQEQPVLSGEVDEL